MDLDTVVARHGANTLKIDATHGEGYTLLAQEVVRVLVGTEFFGNGRD